MIALAACLILAATPTPPACSPAVPAPHIARELHRVVPVRTHTPWRT